MDQSEFYNKVWITYLKIKTEVAMLENHLGVLYHSLNENQNADLQNPSHHEPKTTSMAGSPEDERGEK